MSYKSLNLKKRMAQLNKPRRKFREGSKTERLAFILISKGVDGYLTDAEIRKEICSDLLLIQNSYERAIKMAQRIRSLIRDIRFKFGVWIGRVWIPKEENFVWKVLVGKNEFNQIIKQVQDKIDHLEVLKFDLSDARDNPEYQRKVNKFFEETFK